MQLAFEGAVVVRRAGCGSFCFCIFCGDREEEDRAPNRFWSHVFDFAAIANIAFEFRANSASTRWKSSVRSLVASEFRCWFFHQDLRTEKGFYAKDSCKDFSAATLAISLHEIQ